MYVSISCIRERCHGYQLVLWRIDLLTACRLFWNHIWIDLEVMPSSKPSSARNELVGKAVCSKTCSSIWVCHGLALLRFALARLWKTQKDVHGEKGLGLFAIVVAEPCCWVAMALFASCEYATWILGISSGGRCRNGSPPFSSVGGGESKVSIRSLSCLVVVAILVEFARKRPISNSSSRE